MGLGLQSLLSDWGCEVSLEVLSDSSAARGHVKRRGLGKARHIQTRYLWLQERVAEGHVRVLCVLGKSKMADILTKNVSGALFKEHFTTLHFVVCKKHSSQKDYDPKDGQM